MAIYSIRKPVVNQTTLQEFVDKLDKISFNQNKSDSWFVHRQNPYALSMNIMSGALRFRKEDYYVKNLDRPFDISEQRLLDIARKFIDDTELLPVTATNVRVGKITHLRTRGSSVTGDIIAEQILDAGVILVK